jgi:hypothetical protein
MAEDGSRFLVSDIQHVEPTTEDRPTAVVWLRGDRSVLVEKSALDRLLTLPATLAPAQPNTYVLALASGDSSELDIVRRTAVVAWSIGMDGVVRPVTVDGVAGGGHDLSVETSEGFVTARGARRWLSVEAWLRDQLNPPAAA